ncbi:hypothetical protein WS71_20290 [Burkholderia mayonis]|uniref:Scaffolding protein n=2 Tax=Burkholderia mayonis TaxID=1385591 RepID=A0A1B4G143_9BURK|nr:hypothetical protein WS71_20290 [Burkholderia mayonis]KVE52274.1 hypothetical protein WS71_10115 [Burkholderia mayonis]
MNGYSDEDLAGLTDEEREALQEDDGANDKTTLGESLKDNPDAAESSTAGVDANKVGDKNADDDAAAQSKANDAAASAGDDAAATKTAASDDASTSRPAIVPLLVAEAPADAEAKLKEIGEKKVTLVEQFDNGDITAKEYQTQLDALNKDERSLERALDKAQTAAEMRHQQEMSAWLGEVKDFTSKAHPEYSTSRVRWTALDTFVKEIGSDPANASMSGQDILAKAHEMVVADLGEATAKADAGKKDGGRVDDKAGKPLKGAKIDPPPTLAKVAAAENQDVEGGRWAALDRLQETDPEAHEEKLMKMSAEDRDAYLAARA